MIDVKNLHKSFDGKQVLKGIDEHIEKGEKVVIIGPSGSGKSTFLRCLNLLETPTEGTILMEGADITHASGKELNQIRQKMGMVFQHFNLFPHLTVLKNITLAPVKLGLMTQAEADERARDLLSEGGPFREGGPVSLPAFRRAEAEDRHCARPGHEPRCDAL